MNHRNTSPADLAQHDVRDTRQYCEGRAAYRTAIDSSPPAIKEKIQTSENAYCPYPIGSGCSTRQAWLTGWFDARMVDRLGHIFTRHNLHWPGDDNR